MQVQCSLPLSCSIDRKAVGRVGVVVLNHGNAIKLSGKATSARDIQKGSAFNSGVSFSVAGMDWLAGKYSISAAQGRKE